MSQLRLSLLGPPQVWADDTPLTFATRKALALLIYLIVEGGAQPRDKLLALLWSDSAPKQGRGVLRTTLAYLRRAFDASTALNSAAYLLIEADTIAFNPKADYDLDLHQVDIALRSNQITLLEQAASLYRGDFLIGFSLADAPGFEEMGIIGQGMHSKFAEAVEDCLLCVMSRHDVERLILSKPVVALRFMKVMAERLNKAETPLEDMAFKNIPARMAALLLRLSTEQSSSIQGYTHQDFAESHWDLPRDRHPNPERL